MIWFENFQYFFFYASATESTKRMKWYLFECSTQQWTKQIQFYYKYGIIMKMKHFYFCRPQSIGICVCLATDHRIYRRPIATITIQKKKKQNWKERKPKSENKTNLILLLIIFTGTHTHNIYSHRIGFCIKQFVNREKIKIKMHSHENESNLTHTTYKIKETITTKIFIRHSIIITIRRR